MAGVKYPGAYNDFLAVIDLVNLDLGFILSFACVYDTDFYDRLLLATLGPFVVLAILGFTYVVARHRNRRSREVRFLYGGVGGGTGGERRRLVLKLTLLTGGKGERGGGRGRGEGEGRDEKAVD